MTLMDHLGAADRPRVAGTVPRARSAARGAGRDWRAGGANPQFIPAVIGQTPGSTSATPAGGSSTPTGEVTPCPRRAPGVAGGIPGWMFYHESRTLQEVADFRARSSCVGKRCRGRDSRAF